MTRLTLIGLITLLAPFASKAGRIDTHFHALPPQYVSALKSHGGDPSGYPTPEWSLDGAIKAMDAIGTDIGRFYSYITESSIGHMLIRNVRIHICFLARRTRRRYR